MKLFASILYDWIGDRPQCSIWGRWNDGPALYPPNDPDKSVAKHGGVEGYIKSPSRGLFYHISHGRYLRFAKAAIDLAKTNP